jgi:hypothetical protein
MVAGLVPSPAAGCVRAVRSTCTLTLACYPVRAQQLGDSGMSSSKTSSSKTRSRAAACARQATAPTSRTPFRWEALGLTA